MKKIRFIILLTGLCCFWLSACTPKIPDEAEIVFLSFNDVHGDFENLPKLSAFVKETKAAYKNVIVVDAGDRFAGNPYNDFHEKKQFPIIDLQNLIGVDITVIGNHEFDYGVDLLNERIQETEAAVVSANIELENSGLKGINPYHIIKKDGLKIAFLGLTNVDEYTGKPIALPIHVEHIQFYDPIETALKYGYLKKKSHVFVALTHIGFDEDVELAYAMPDLNLIIGGHSHTLIEEKIIRNGVLITQAGNKARHVGKTKILLKKGVVSEITNEMINLATWNGAADPVIVKKVQEYEDNTFLKKPFVTLRYEIPDQRRLGYMIADAALQLPDVDFSIMNCLGVRVDNLPAESVTYGDIYRLSPFNNYYYIVPLNPSDIRRLIEQEFMERKSCLSMPAGFEYTVHKTNDGYIKVEKLTFPNGKELDENKTYQVAVNNYLFTKYLINLYDITKKTDVFKVDNIVEYLQNNPNVDYRNVRTRAKYSR
ncbi:MAG: bifunctional metallophosphatase/5'-nucleotidase [Bacteroidales bacterium]|jgi:2',3'-cyclic-nucleotide 2'-phosphodiesterase (5'-nucleotidase family)|nr:bifunctional metallophosphatase/5'-nucleotidase [Bacteroidales bacterium]